MKTHKNVTPQGQQSINNVKHIASLQKLIYKDNKYLVIKKNQLGNYLTVKVHSIAKLIPPCKKLLTLLHSIWYLLIYVENYLEIKQYSRPKINILHVQDAEIDA